MVAAKQVPALVATLQDYLLTEDYREFAFRFFTAALEQKPADGWNDLTILKYSDHWRQSQHDLLNISRLFHVTESMLEVAKVAAQKLDPTSRWNLESAPAPHGFLMFEKPLYVKDVWGRKMAISAVSWDWEGKDFAVVHYVDPDDPQDDYNRALAARNSLSLRCGPLHVSHVEGWKGEIGKWMTGTSQEILDYRSSHKDMVGDWALESPEVLPPSIPEFANVSMILYAIFALMDQTIVALSEETDHKLTRRIRNKRRPPPMVTVIQLRRKEYHGYHQPGTGIWLTYRSVTRGHWRNQPYGPGRSEYRKIWINPYIRGDESLPFWQPKRVNTLAR